MHSKLYVTDGIFFPTFEAESNNSDDKVHINILIKAIRLSPKISVFLESIYQKYSSEKVIYYCDILNHISTLRSLRHGKNKMRPKENLLLISDTQWRKRAKIEGKKVK